MTGPTGPTGGAGDFAYVYNDAAEVVAIEAPISFDSNGPLSGIDHAPGDAGITIIDAGTYLIDFSVSGVEPSQFAVFVNGTPALGGTYGSGAGTQQDNGQVVLDLSAGDVVTLVNHSSAAAVTLQTLDGGTQQNVNASIVMKEIG